MVTQDLTDRDFYQAIDKSTKIYVVVFWATWSIACTLIMETLERLGKKYTDRVDVGKVNIEDEKKIVNDLDVQNIPTIIFFKRGKEIDRMPGTVTYVYLSRRLDRILVSSVRKGKQKKTRP